jgi:hypothetical protein
MISQSLSEAGHVFFYFRFTGESRVDERDGPIKRTETPPKWGKGVIATVILAEVMRYFDIS